MYDFVSAVCTSQHFHLLSCAEAPDSRGCCVGWMQTDVTLSDEAVGADYLVPSMGSSVAAQGIIGGFLYNRFFPVIVSPLQFIG